MIDTLFESASFTASFCLSESVNACLLQISSIFPLATRGGILGSFASIPLRISAVSLSAVSYSAIVTYCFLRKTIEPLRAKFLASSWNISAVTAVFFSPSFKSRSVSFSKSLTGIQVLPVLARLWPIISNMPPAILSGELSAAFSSLPILSHVLKPTPRIRCMIYGFSFIIATASVPSRSLILTI